MPSSILAQKDRISLGNGFDLRLLSALEVLQAHREGRELAERDEELELCADACLMARALEGTEDRTPAFSGGQEVLAGLTAEEILALTARWSAFSQESAPVLEGPSEEETRPRSSAPEAREETELLLPATEPKRENQRDRTEAPPLESLERQERAEDVPAEEGGALDREGDSAYEEAPLERRTGELPELDGERRKLPGASAEAGDTQERDQKREAPAPPPPWRTRAEQELPLPTPPDMDGEQSGLPPSGWDRSDLYWAERADRAFRRDSRRYDGGFYLY